MLLHYFGKLETQIWLKLHCTLKNSAFTRWNLDRFSKFFHCWKNKKIMNKTTTNWKKNFFRSTLELFMRAASSPQSALAHVSSRSISLVMLFMMRTTDDLGMPIPVIFHRLCCEFGAGPFDSDSEPYHSPDQCFHPCRHSVVCHCSEICLMCLCLWTSQATC